MRKNKVNTKKMSGGKMLSLFLLVVVLSSLLLFQYYRINQANLAIRDLEAKIKEQEMVNDSLEGELLAKRDLDRVEKIAIEEYGMVKPTAEKYSYVAVDFNEQSSLATSNEGSSGILGWFNNLIK